LNTRRAAGRGPFGGGGNGGGGRDFIAHLSRRSSGFLRGGIIFAHDRGEIQVFHLRRLIPRMTAARAFQSAALLSQQFCRDFKMRRAIGAGDAHPFTQAPRQNEADFSHPRVKKYGLPDRLRYGEFFIVHMSTLIGAKHRSDLGFPADLQVRSGLKTGD